ncbi:MAG: hypothetical protein ACI4Q3_08725 [Kiritimatiellia bacterium]
MKTAIVIAGLVCLAAIAGCGNSEPRYCRQPAQNQPAPKPKRPPTPEETLGIEMPGKLAASVEAWANSNELGDYFRQSRKRLSHLHAQLMEDYGVRKESELEPTDFTRETLRKYHEAFDADSALRRFMVECYSRKEVRPLPQTILRRFTTPGEDREKLRQLIENAPGEIERLKVELTALKSEMEAVETSTWSQEKELRIWRDLQIRVGKISTRANKTSSSVSALAADMAKAVRESGENADVDRLNDQAEQLKSDISSFAACTAKQLEIVNGQLLIAEFAMNCKNMADGMNCVPAALAKKKARQAEITELVSRIASSRTRGYSDLNMLAQQATSIKARSRSEGEKEAELGKRVQKLAGNYEHVFGSLAIYSLKQALPEPSAQARIDSELAAFKMAINLSQGADPSGVFAVIEAKAYQLADRMEEEAMLKRLDDTLLTVQRLAAGRR